MRHCDTVTVTKSASFTWQLSVRWAPEGQQFALLAFQTNRESNQLENPVIFDNYNIKNMHVVLNSDRYPADDYNSNFTTQSVSRFYKDAADFATKIQQCI